MYSSWSKSYFLDAEVMMKLNLKFFCKWKWASFKECFLHLLTIFATTLHPDPPTTTHLKITILSPPSMISPAGVPALGWIYSIVAEIWNIVSIVVWYNRQYKVLTYKMKGWKLDTPEPLHDHVAETTQHKIHFV